MKTRKFVKFACCMTLICVAAIVFSCFLSKDTKGLVVDIVAAVVMLGLILWGIFGRTGIGALEAAENTLKKMKEVIDVTAADPDANIESALSRDDLYENAEIKDAYDTYRKECDRLFREDQDYKYCDIADYINEELLSHIAHASFNDLVGSTMTGLGILGTFIGLTLGLQGFRNGNAEEMLETIRPLIEGIKVAFLTSIFGMVYSIVFNFCYHRQIREAADALNAFLEDYYENVGQRPDNEGFTKLIQLQSEQRDSMSQFAEDIALSFADQVNQTFGPTMQNIGDAVKMQAESLPQAVSAAINDSVVPSLSGIQDNIGQMADRMVNIQDQNMGKIANDFVMHMDEAMGNQFTELRKSIVSLAEWQELMTENMKDLVEKLVTSGESLNHISEDVAQASDTVGNLVERLEKSQEEILDRYAEVLNNSKQISEMTKQQSTMMDEILQKEMISMESIAGIADIFENQNTLMKESFDSLFGLFSDSMQEQKRTFDEDLQKRYSIIEHAIATRTDQVTEALEQSLVSLKEGAQNINKMQVVMIDAMRDTSGEMTRASDAMNAASSDLSSGLENALSRTFRQIDEQLAGIEKHLSGTISEIREITETVPNSVQLSVKESAEHTDAYMKKLQSALNVMSQTLEEREKMMVSIIQQQQEIINSVKNDRQ